MTQEEAERILMEHRPDRPYKLEGKKFQAAIDKILSIVHEGKEKK